VALVAVLVGFPLSFGPACWIVSRAQEKVIPRLYLPIGAAWFYSYSAMVDLVVRKYACFGMPSGTWAYVQIDSRQDWTGSDCFVLLADN
jgi:hypothetical protein